MARCATRLAKIKAVAVRVGRWYLASSGLEADRWKEAIRLTASMMANDRPLASQAKSGWVDG
jgi:hypothetical protein